MNNAPRLACVALLFAALAPGVEAQPAVGVAGRLAGERGGGSLQLGRELFPGRALHGIRVLMQGHTDRREEARILRWLGEAGDGQLELLLQNLDLAALLDAVDDRLLGPDHRSALLRLLTRTRLDALSAASRARLVEAIQEELGGETAEAAVEAILLGTRGEALRRLKLALDGGGDTRDLQALVFCDLEDESRRARVLAHIANQAGGGERLKVLSDIDDTLYASWKDKRYPSGTVYPGVRTLYAELARGPRERPVPAGELTFITARPGDRAGLVEGKTHADLAAKGVAEAVILTGDLSSLITHARMARRKLRNFTEYQQLYPEYGFVFLGDSGQGDAAFGRMMREARPDALRGVFIHDVVGTDAARRARWAAEGVLFCDTYLDAAVAAEEAGLIGSAGLARVAEAAWREHRDIAYDSPAQHSARAAELRRAGAAANRRLPPGLRVAFAR